MKKNLTIIAFLACAFVLFSVSVSAQKKNLKKMKWETELCEFEGTYNSAKYTELQLRNTRELKYSLKSIPLSTTTAAFKIEDIEKLNVEELDAEYRRKIEELKNLDIVEDAYWRRMRDRKIKITEQFYKFERFNILGYTNPKILLEAENTGECRAKYAEPLAVGGDSLLAAWKKLVNFQKTQNADPDRLQREFEMQFNSPEKFEHALVKVLTFGWGNCVNKTINHISPDEPTQENFDRLFVKLKKIYCDEP